MTYKEFVSWCHDRVCDGCWGMQTAMICIEIVKRINSLPFWKRKKEWLKIKDAVEAEIVSVINAHIQALREGDE